MLYVWLELVWWAFTALLAFGVLFPIWQSVVDYPFWAANIIFIISAVTLTRYIFLTKFTFLGDRTYLKAALILISAPIVFYLINNLVDFRTHMDEIGLEASLINLIGDDKESMYNYIETEMLFFGVTSVVAMIVFPLKMLKSIWRNLNN